MKSGMIGTTSALALLLVGCGGVSASTEDGAVQGWNATNDTLEDGSGSPSKPFSAPSQAFGMGGDGSMTVNDTASCDEGGSAHFTGEMVLPGFDFDDWDDFDDDDDVDDFDDFEMSIDLSVTYEGCTVEGIVIDGYLDYELELTDVAFTSGYEGSLAFSGDVTGGCDIDFSLDVDLEEGLFVYGGTICGFDVEGLDGLETAADDLL